jgi:hypothetical protein
LIRPGYCPTSSRKRSDGEELCDEDYTLILCPSRHVDCRHLPPDAADRAIPTETLVPVNPDNFNRAECDTVFRRHVKESGLGKFVHHRNLIALDFPVIRPNRDALYSLAVFDLDAGPVTVTLPDAGNRFISLQVIDEDQYRPQVVYGKGSYTFTKRTIGTRYISIGIRVLVNPANPADIKRVHALQDLVKLQQTDPGRFAIPNWDLVSQKRMRDALLAT